MPSPIISDTSCLIILDKIDELELLHKLFEKIFTTQEVAFEYGKLLPAWVEIKNPINTTFQTIIKASVDQGEASAIALALEFEDSLLIIDDLKGRNFAVQLGLKITGTLGILVEAKLAGHLPALKPVLEKIKRTNFRLSEKLEKLILARVNE